MSTYIRSLTAEKLLKWPPRPKYINEFKYSEAAKVVAGEQIDGRQLCLHWRCEILSDTSSQFCRCQGKYKEQKTNTGRHSSVDLSAPSTLPPRIRVPSSPPMLLSIYIDLCHVEKTKIKQKEGGLALFLNNSKRRTRAMVVKWSVCSPFTLTIRVRILLESRVFIVHIVWTKLN